jgi:hypothetical protein
MCQTRTLAFCMCKAGFAVVLLKRKGWCSFCRVCKVSLYNKPRDESIHECQVVNHQECTGSCIRARVQFPWPSSRHSVAVYIKTMWNRQTKYVCRSEVMDCLDSSRRSKDRGCKQFSRLVSTKHNSVPHVILATCYVGNPCNFTPW